MIISFKKYKLFENIQNYSNNKLLLSIEIYDLLNEINHIVIIDDVFISWNKNNKITKIFIQKDKDNYNYNDVIITLTTIIKNTNYDVCLFDKLSIQQMNTIYNYLKEKYPTEYNTSKIKKSTKIYNL